MFLNLSLRGIENTEAIYSVWIATLTLAMTNFFARNDNILAVIRSASLWERGFEAKARC